MFTKLHFLTLFFVLFSILPSHSQTYQEWIDQSFDYLDKDSLSQAEKCIKNAMRLEPAHSSNGMLFVNLGTIQRRLGKLEEAETSYSCAISLLVDYPSVRVNRAELYAEMERYKDAIEDYSELLRIEPQNEEWLYQRALCRLMSSDTLGAREDLEFIDKFNPQSAKSRIGMAIIYKAQGLYSMAEELYNGLIKANPKSWSLLRDRAEVYYLSKRNGAALTDIDEAIRRNNKDPMSYILRAQIRYSKGDKVYAQRDLHTALEKGAPQQIVSDLLEKFK